VTQIEEGKAILAYFKAEFVSCLRRSNLSYVLMLLKGGYILINVVHSPHNVVESNI